MIPRGGRRSPKFLGYPSTLVPRPLTPVDRCPPRLHGEQRVAFAAHYKLGAHIARISGLYHAARSLAVYASQPPSPTSTQHSLPSRWLGFARAGFAPAGQHHRVSGCATRHTSFPSIQACLAHSEKRPPLPPLPVPIRRILYTTNCIESLNAQVRKVTRNRGPFPRHAVFKLFFLAIQNAKGTWNAPHHWS